MPSLRKNFLYSVLCGLFGAAVMMHSGYAITSDDDCQYFSPAFVLCSVHSHNIGIVEDDSTKKPTNPISSEQIADMNEVIAYKSTVIAQQLKKQYDALNAIIKQFKTQLEKAVLTSKMEMVTGTSSSSSSYVGSSSNGNVGVDGAEECEFASSSQLHDCLRRNLNRIKQAVDKNLSGAKAQLKSDTAVMTGFNMCGEGKECVDFCGNLSRQEIKTCITKLISYVGSDERNQQNKRSSNRSDKDY